MKFLPVAHIIYEANAFYRDIENIKQLFTNKHNPDYLLENINYRENMPIDGLELYFKQLWDKINSNKNLFLPSEKKLAAHLRCTEIKKQKLEEFSNEFAKISFSKSLIKEITRIYNYTVSIYKNETKQYDLDSWKACLDELETQMTNSINIFCEKEINKICQKSQKSLILEYEELFKMKKFDNIYNDFEIILKNKKKETETLINQCFYRNIDMKKIDDINLILDSICNSQFQKFLQYFLRENENILIRKFIEDFDLQVDKGLNFEFWGNFHLNMHNKINTHQQNMYNLLTKNFKLEELNAKKSIFDLLEKTINEVLDRIKMKFNDNLDVFLIGQLKREINISKDGKIIEWSSEEKFLTIFNEKLKNIDQLVGILQFFNLKFQIFDQNIQKQIIVIDNNENLKNKKDIIQKELISFREVTINQIVRILFLSCFVINYIL